MTRRHFSRWLAGLAASTLMARHGFAQNRVRPPRVAISVETLAGVNPNDARAAYRVWSREIMGGLGTTSSELVPDIYFSSEQTVQMIKWGAIDMFGITALEYSQVVDFIDASSVVVADYMADGMEYILLVHNDSNFKKLRDLRGGKLIMEHHRDMNVAPAWIGNLLATDNLPQMNLFFGGHLVRDSITQVVLPVFFRSMDAACLVRRHFETAVELNPQLGKGMHALAISPKVVPNVFCFHKNCNAEIKRAGTDVITNAANVPAGRQMLALFQSRSLVSRPGSCMKTTLDLLHSYALASARTPGRP